MLLVPGWMLEGSETAGYQLLKVEKEGRHNPD
jgi:hypothetical protein